MSIEQYEQSHLLFNTNFKGKTSEEGVEAYRGELVLIENELDDKGHPKPPLAIMRHAVLLTKNDKLAFVVGCLDEVSLVETFIEKYKADFAEDMQVLFFVVNITSPMQVEVDGINYVLIPLTEGVAWNELIEELAMEKSDFKGQSAADKVVTAYDEFKSGYTPKYDKVSLETALASAADIKRESLGAV
jgi:hypothetical protein